ncbi:MAG: hypothetical protein ACLUD2_05690 [Clostridium sp.]
MEPWYHYIINILKKKTRGLNTVKQDRNVKKKIGRRNRLPESRDGVWMINLKSGLERRLGKRPENLLSRKQSRKRIGAGLGRKMARMQIRNQRGILLMEKLKNSEKQMESLRRRVSENLPVRIL